MGKKNQCRVVVKKVIYEEIKACPFAPDISLRELARLTGLDVGYLSRVKRGIIPVTEENLHLIERAQAAVV